jgi:hypothetical protein
MEGGDKSVISSQHPHEISCNRNELEAVNLESPDVEVCLPIGPEGNFIAIPESRPMSFSHTSQGHACARAKASITLKMEVVYVLVAGSLQNSSCHQEGSSPADNAQSPTSSTASFQPKHENNSCA